MPAFCQDDFLFDRVEERAEQTRTIFTLPGTQHFYYFTVNLHALVCSETNEPRDPAALISHWGSPGKLAVPLRLLGDGTLALEYSTGHYGAGKKQIQAHVDK